MQTHTDASMTERQSATASGIDAEGSSLTATVSSVPPPKLGQTVYTLSENTAVLQCAKILVSRLVYIWIYMCAEGRVCTCPDVCVHSTRVIRLNVSD